MVAKRREDRSSARQEKSDFWDEFDDFCDSATTTQGFGSEKQRSLLKGMSVLQAVLLLAFANVAVTRTNDKPVHSAVRALSEDSLFSHVANHPEGTLVNFHSDGCSFCDALAPELEAAAKELQLRSSGSTTVVSVNAAKAPAALKRYNVSKFPMLLWFRKGQPVREVPVSSRSASKILEFVEWSSQPAVIEFGKRADLDEAVPQIRAVLKPGLKSGISSGFVMPHPQPLSDSKDTIAQNTDFVPAALVQDSFGQVSQTLRDVLSELRDFRDEVRISSGFSHHSNGVLSSNGYPVAVKPAPTDCALHVLTQNLKQNSSVVKSGVSNTISHIAATTINEASLNASINDSSPRYKTENDFSPKVTRESPLPRDLLFPRRLTAPNILEAKPTVAPREHPCLSLKTFVECYQMEALVSILILLTAMVNAVELQLEGMETGHVLGIHYYEPAEKVWPGGINTLKIIDDILSIVFILELFLRVIALRCEVFRQAWNWLDLVVVITSILDLANVGGAGGKGLRMLRLVKISRGLRVIKVHRFVHALQMLLTSIYVSISTLFWALVIIFGVQCIAAMLLTSVVDPFYDEADHSILEKQEVFLYFGTFTRSLITAFEILFANWATPCRVLVNNIGEEYGGIVIAYRCFCGFAVLSVVQAVFLQQTIKVMSQDSDVMLTEKKEAERKYRANLEKLFRKLDLHSSGYVTWDDIAAVLDHEDVVLYCHVLGLDPHDLEDVFHLLDSGEGMLIKDFIDAAHQIRKQARNVDMARVLASSRKIRHQLSHMQTNMTQLLKASTLWVSVK